MIQSSNNSLKRIHSILIFLTICCGAMNITYVCMQPESDTHAVFFCAIQYIVLLVILLLPAIVQRCFNIRFPLHMVVAFATFAFLTMVLGDGLDFYGRFTWWDSLAHLFSGSVLALIGVWITTLLSKDDAQHILSNKYLLAFIVAMFGITCGSIWKVCEYTYDAFTGTNTQQFMATTTSSITSPEDVPLCGHDALQDTMMDTILNLIGSTIVAVGTIFFHNQLLHLCSSE